MDHIAKLEAEVVKASRAIPHRRPRSASAGRDAAAGIGIGGSLAAQSAANANAMLWGGGAAPPHQNLLPAAHIKGGVLYMDRCDAALAAAHAHLSLPPHPISIVELANGQYYAGQTGKRPPEPHVARQRPPRLPSPPPREIYMKANAAARDSATASGRAGWDAGGAASVLGPLPVHERLDPLGVRLSPRVYAMRKAKE